MTEKGLEELLQKGPFQREGEHIFFESLGSFNQNRGVCKRSPNNSKTDFL
jgi:hypothetical protein